MTGDPVADPVGVSGVIATAIGMRSRGCRHARMKLVTGGPPKSLCPRLPAAEVAEIVMMTIDGELATRIECPALMTWTTGAQQRSLSRLAVVGEAWIASVAAGVGVSMTHLRAQTGRITGGPPNALSPARSEKWDPAADMMPAPGVQIPVTAGHGVTRLQSQTLDRLNDRD